MHHGERRDAGVPFQQRRDSRRPLLGNAIKLPDRVDHRTIVGVEAMRAAGLGLGGSLQNAVVLDEFRILNSEGLRYDNEFVRHKVLDAIGDLYLLGHPLIGQYTAYKSGHALNNALARALLARADAHEVVTFAIEADAPSAFQDWRLAPA